MQADTAVRQAVLSAPPKIPKRRSGWAEEIERPWRKTPAEPPRAASASRSLAVSLYRRRHRLAARRRPSPRPSPLTSLRRRPSPRPSHPRCFRRRPSPRPSPPRCLRTSAPSPPPRTQGRNTQQWRWEEATGGRGENPAAEQKIILARAATPTSIQSTSSSCGDESFHGA